MVLNNSESKSRDFITQTLNVGRVVSVSVLRPQLMKSFSVMPMDQHLSLNGLVLEDDKATLGSLGVHPGSLLLLKVRSKCARLRALVRSYLFVRFVHVSC